MKVVLVDASVQAANVAERILANAGHSVSVVTDVDRALSSIQEAPPDLLVVEPKLAKTSGLELVKQVRKINHTGYVYILTLATDGAPAAVAAAYAAGSDDFMRKPVTREELLGRAAGAERLQAIVKAAITRATHLDNEVGNAIERLEAWKHVDEITCQELAAMLNAEFQRHVWHRPSNDAFGATIRLTLPSERLDVRFSIIADIATYSVLGNLVLGVEPSAVERDDLIKEMVNTAAGAFKRNLLQANVDLTIGLPEPTTAEIAQQIPDGTAVQRSVLVGEGATLHAIVTVGPQPNELVPANRLREGMVVVRAVTNESGALLIPAGTRVTSSTADRVAKQLGEQLIAVTLV